MWNFIVNDMFHYMSKAEFVIRSQALKVPSGRCRGEKEEQEEKDS